MKTDKPVNAVTCPICKQVVELSALATNMAGERIMEFHAPQWRCCAGSFVSVAVARRILKAAAK